MKIQFKQPQPKQIIHCSQCLNGSCQTLTSKAGK